MVLMVPFGIRLSPVVMDREDEFGQSLHAVVVDGSDLALDLLHKFM